MFIARTKKIVDTGRHGLGFERNTNFVFFVIFAGALLGFTLARLAFLDVSGYYRRNAGPGEWYWFKQRLYNVGLTMHLATILPASFLVVTQFIPAIRRKYPTIHRINGHIALILLLISIAGAVIITRRAFGGSLAAQTGIGALAFATVITASLGYYNIRRRNIMQHRAWMLRTWFYAGSIVTLRLIFFIAALIISRIGTYYTIIPCGQILEMNGNFLGYPTCTANPDGLAIVKANLVSPASVAEAAAALQLTFGLAGWLAWAIHAAGIEWYIQSTKIGNTKVAEPAMSGTA
jgi:hypothetical protein